MINKTDHDQSMTNKNTLVLLAGWGLGVAPLQALAAALTHELKIALPDFTLQLQPLPDLVGKDWVGKNITTLIQQLDNELPKNCWLAGWSLGGMLATAVAAQRQSATPTVELKAGLISLASNACFVANDTWPNAMPASTFAEFYKLCQTDLAMGLKRFSLLCSQGAEQPRLLSRQLLDNTLKENRSISSELLSLELLAGLELLAKLDNRAAITHFSAPQLYLFAAADALVPVAAAADFQNLNVAAIVEKLGHSHASVLAEPQLLAQRMAAFIVSNTIASNPNA